MAFEVGGRVVAESESTDRRRRSAPQIPASTQMPSTTAIPTSGPVGGPVSERVPATTGASTVASGAIATR